MWLMTYQDFFDLLHWLLHWYPQIHIIFRLYCIQRDHRVKIDKAFSDWLKLNGGIPQGSQLGPYVCLMLINDLKMCVSVHKVVDDTTFSEIIASKSGP